MENTNDIKNKLQNEALERFKEHYYNLKNPETRGILCACCGYGKTYLIYKIIKYCIEVQHEKIFIVSTSRIKLIEQLAFNVYKWSKNDNVDIEIFALCSDNIYRHHKKRESKYKININDDSIIKKIIKKNKIKLFLTTYNSANKLVEKISYYNKKQEELDNSQYLQIEPDLIIMDEAHNTVGSGKNKITGEKFHHELFKKNDNFKASKYLFLTATPLVMKHKNPNSIINTEETLYSMDNINIYGKIFYYYSFAQGIHDKIITNFKTIYLEQNKDFDDKTKNIIKSMSKEDKKELYFKEICSLLIQSMIKYDFNKTIVFIGNQEKASLFMEKLNEIKNLDQFKKIKRINFDIYKITSDMTNSAKRKAQKNFINSSKSILISVNIFNEGIDIPECDSILFAEERHSSTTIIQNIGRCLRTINSNPNKIGHVIIPNIIYEIGELNDTCYSSKFKNIRKCIDIIRKNKSHYVFEKFTNNKKKITDSNINSNNESDFDDEIDSDSDSDSKSNSDSSLDIISDLEKDNIGELSSQNVLNIKDSSKLIALELLNHYKIKDKIDGLISNISLEDIKNKYIIEKNIKNIKEFGIVVKKEKDDHLLRPDKDYPNEWISWDYFFNSKLIKYNECKKLITYINEHITIKSWHKYLQIYEYIIDTELDELNSYNDDISYIFLEIESKNKIIYKNILNAILQIPKNPEKYFNSSKEWIDMKDFLNLDYNQVLIYENFTKKIINIENNKNNEFENLKNLFNNDLYKVKKGKWNYINIKISKLLSDLFVKNCNYNDVLHYLYVRFQLNKNLKYYSSEIIMSSKDNYDNIENIFSKIILDEYKFIKYDSKIKEKIIREDYLDKNYQYVINNIIDIIKKNIDKDFEFVQTKNNNININNINNIKIIDDDVKENIKKLNKYNFFKI